MNDTSNVANEIKRKECLLKKATEHPIRSRIIKHLKEASHSFLALQEKVHCEEYELLQHLNILRRVGVIS